ncbi:MAG: ATP-dependent zinc metalloprotease FtsH [Verrucomicrobiaceae bacterium]|nr:ATP-dependent zinc metalloprotease FtsH [Verrucomicrobiaceae bacterium]
MLFVLAIFLLAGGIWASNKSTSQKMNYADFKSMVTEDRIDKSQPLKLISFDTTSRQLIRGLYFEKGRSVAPPAPVTVDATDAAPVPQAPPVLTPGKPASLPRQFEVEVNIDFQKEELQKLLAAHKIDIVAHTEAEPWAMVSFLLPLAIVLALFYFLVRQQIRSAGRGALSFGKSRAKMLSQDRNKVTFKDVAGVEEAKEEVQELVEFLKDPKKFQRLGGKIPKGVLMVGPPGTGKTLLAKAIAGEADVPFFSISGSDFVEMFVGVGASRVRDMFEQGRKNAPCLIFIDEIDAVGRHRGHGLGGGHDEREQTLNAMLVEMDGFDTQEGIIIIAATNRPDVLDPALLRPGRFDRQVTVSLPDVKGREEILRVHAKKVKLAENADLSKIARGTPGFSGAELANLLNEAALLAARQNLKAITNAELEEARDKVRWGRERRSMAMSEKEKQSTAWHEAGHAIVSVLLEHTDPLHKVTIIPRGHALGVTMSLPEGDQHSFHLKEALDRIAMTAAGRIAEELFTHDLSTGASNDIKQMTRLARNMVCEWGMSEKLGMVGYGSHEDQVFLGRDINRSRDYSEATAQEIDREVRRLVDEGYERAKKLILDNRDKVELIANALLEYETLDGDQVKDIVMHGRMLNPPETRSKPPPPPPLPKAQGPRPAKVEDEDTGGLAPGLAGATA